MSLRYCSCCDRERLTSEFPKPKGSCKYCLNKRQAKKHELASAKMLAGGVPPQMERKLRNTPQTVLSGFNPPDDSDAFSPILSDILALHDPYPAYQPKEANHEQLTPAVNPTTYPLCAGVFSLSPAFFFAEDDQFPGVTVSLSELLARVKRTEDGKRLSSNLAYTVLRYISSCDNFTYVLHHIQTYATGYSFGFNCTSDFASRDRHKPKPPAAKPRNGNSRLRFDCGGHINISVTTAGVSIDYKHRPIHKAAPCRKVSESIKNLLNTYHFPSSRELRRHILSSKDEVLRNITTKQTYYWWARICKDKWCRDADEFKSMELLLKDREPDGFNGLDEVLERDVSMAWTVPFWTDDVVDVPTIAEIFVDATYKTNKKGYELYCVLAQRMSVSIPLSYLLLNTRKVGAAGKRTERLARWFMALRENGLKPQWILTDKDLAEVTASRVVWPEANHQLCHWHAHRSIEKRLKSIKKPGPSKRKSTGRGHSSGDSGGALVERGGGGNLDDSDDDRPDDAGENQGEPFIRSLVAAESLPPYLQWLAQDIDWINSADPKDVIGKRLLTDEQLKELRNICHRHFTQHPWIPHPKPAFLTWRGPDGQPLMTVPDGHTADMFPAVTAPEKIQEERERIHAMAVGEIHHWCKNVAHSPAAFRYLWANWYRRGSGNRQARWELVSLSWKNDLPISTTTMRIEAHWKHLKRTHLYGFPRPRLDFLLVMLCDKHYPDILDKWNLILSGRETPRHYQSLAKEWRTASKCVTEDTEARGCNIYLTDHINWVCGCPAYSYSGLRLCKHLVCSFTQDPQLQYAPPPKYHPNLFQHTLPPLQTHLPPAVFPLAAIRQHPATPTRGNDHRLSTPTPTSGGSRSLPGPQSGEKRRREGEDSPIRLTPRARCRTQSQAKESGARAQVAAEMMDVSGEDDCGSNKENIPEYEFAVVKARAVLDAVNDARRQRELITRGDVTIGKNLKSTRRRLGPHTNRAPQGTQFDP